ncbi:MAG: hypothetical protein EPN23_10285 [Verrucomicrobia bacterium]|nr:MAG: hypothetical protein EPN23_10285 [Verrucomicrobiota bacterium]
MADHKESQHERFVRLVVLLELCVSCSFASRRSILASYFYGGLGNFQLGDEVFPIEYRRNKHLVLAPLLEFYLARLGILFLLVAYALLCRLLIPENKKGATLLRSTYLIRGLPSPVRKLESAPSRARPFAVLFPYNKLGGFE